MPSRSFRLSFCAALFFLAATTGAGFAEAGPKVAPAVFTASTTAIAVNAGQTFLIALNSNPTTGYTWSAIPGFAGTVIAVDGSSYRRPDAAIPGAGGMQIFVVRALGAGSTKLVLGYARPFEKGTAPVRQATFAIAVH